MFGAGLFRCISLLPKVPAMGDEASAGESTADVLVLPLRPEY